MDPLPALMTPREVAAVCRVSRSTVLRWVARGDLLGRKVGRQIRIPQADVVRKLGELMPDANAAEEPAPDRVA